MIALHHKLYLATAVAALAVAGTASYYFVQTERHTYAVVQDLDAAIKSGGEIESQINAVLKGNPAKGDPGILVRASLLVANADSAMNALKQTMQTVNTTTKANADKTATIAESSIALLGSGKTAVDNVGTSVETLNGTVAILRDQTLPKMNGAVDAVTGVLNGLKPVEDGATGTLTALQGTVQRANLLLGDPNLTGVAANLNLASGNLNQGMLHFNRALGYVEAGSDSGASATVEVSFVSRIVEGDWDTTGLFSNARERGDQCAGAGDASVSGEVNAYAAHVVEI